MTTDPFAVRMREQARHALASTCSPEDAYVIGALDARDHLATQEPTDAEVEAAAEGMWDRYGNRGMWKHAPDHLRLAFRADARAALSAARAARRDEEKR